jgi:hypothetical protein
LGWGGGGGVRCKGKAAKPMRGYFAREEKILNISGVSYLLFFIASFEFGHQNFGSGTGSNSLEIMDPDLDYGFIECGSTTLLINIKSFCRHIYYLLL